MLNLVASSSTTSRRLRLVHVIIRSGSPYVLVSSISSTRALMSGYVLSMLGLPAPWRRIASPSAGGVSHSLLISRIPARTVLGSSPLISLVTLTPPYPYPWATHPDNKRFCRSLRYCGITVKILFRIPSNRSFASMRRNLF